LSDHDDNLLSTRQLRLLESAFHQGAADASVALARWLEKPSVVEVDSLEQLPLEEATDVLGAGEEPICFCTTEMSGLLAGELILAFDDASGLALADMLLDDPRGTAEDWDDMATSAAMETANILCCAYLGSLARTLKPPQGESELMPAPPRFSRDFAASLVQFALMGQAVQSDHVLLARTRFLIDGAPVSWTLLLIPDASSMSVLREVIPSSERSGTEVS
jgi:chemotaxis protein CheC